MATYPGALPSFAGFTAGHTLAADNHASQHNSEQAEITAIATKVGTGASTSTSGTVLRGTGAGTSAWGQVQLTSDVTGTLPVANGGTGINSLGSGVATFLGTPSSANLAAAVTDETGTGPLVFGNSPTITSPTITNATISTDAITGFSTSTNGTIFGINITGSALTASSAISDGIILPNALQSGTGSSWAWQSWTPTLTNHSGTINLASYIQVGKIVMFRVQVTMTGAASGVIRFSLPVAASSSEPTTATALNFIGIGNAVDAGVNNYDVKVALASTTTADLYAAVATGGFTNPQSSSASVPFTWGNADGYIVRGSYEAA